jgi:hypothetical protein
MNRAIAYLLMLLMVTPSLVCSMPMSADSVELTRKAMQSHCGELDKTDSSQVEKPKQIMLYVDCMGIDLHSTALPNLVAEPVYDLKIDWGVTTSPDALSFDGLYLPGPIRGSPLAADFSFRKPAVYLATKRFRI